MQDPTRLKLAVATAVSIVVGACSPAATRVESTETATPTATEEFVRGTILPGNDLRFRPCDQDGDLPLRPVDLFTGNLLDEIAEAGDPIYAEFLGRGGGRVPTMTVTRLLYAARESQGCDARAPDHEFRAHGNEPFWSVEIRSGRAVWKTPEDPDGVSFGITARERVGNGWLLTALDGDTRLAISFAGTPCRDSMADAWFGYTVQLEIGEVEYRGCGRSGRRGN